MLPVCPSAHTVELLLAMAPALVTNLVSSLRAPPSGTCIREVVVALGSRLDSPWFAWLADLGVRVCEGAHSAWHDVLTTAKLDSLIPLINAVCACGGVLSSPSCGPCKERKSDFESCDSVP